MGSLCLLLVVLQLSWTLSSSLPPPSSHLCLPHHRDALLHFKTTVSVACFRDLYPKIDIESWNKSIDCCSWEGVKCNNVTGHVIGIDLSHSCLDGFPLENSSNLFQFHGLKRLNLAYNSLEGYISTELFSQLVSLTHLNLSYNGFFGLIPYQINLLSSLVSLDLSLLDELRFDGQGFDMLARNLTKLRNLVLYEVDMSDVAITSFLNLSSSLEHLSLSYCQLHGEFPTQAFQLPNLKVLDLSENENLKGYLPNTNWSSGLELLYLFHCGFRGSIPASFGNLTQIISVDLLGNSLGGQIPDVFGNLRKLTFLSFSSCNLSGPLPITIFNLTKITHLDLSNNHLEGPFPNHVSELQFVEKFWLFNNSISGGVPSWLFTLPSLPQLDLSYNNIGGSIPDFNFDLVKLTYLDLSSNNLSGPIPDSIFDLVNITSLDLSSNNLSGVIKSDMLSKLTSLEVLDVSNNSLLSLSTSGNDVNYSFPGLTSVRFSGCSVRQFPNFFR
ncbi:receptor-like protein Cf-9 [Gossypium arboreum]|uniref:receptor-like protein Cf-9 n=1 Tax=Gossypium arboreum TaxID=29729 RepID=UPI00081917B2|nr:receptor-like protein Cf-9 [Gossypium arboreum]